MSDTSFPFHIILSLYTREKEKHYNQKHNLLAAFYFNNITGSNEEKVIIPCTLMKRDAIIHNPSD